MIYSCSVSSNVPRISSQRSTLLVKLSLVLVITLLISACKPLDMVDVSADPMYSHLIGKEFVTQENLWATGITLERNYKPRLDYVALVPGVGFTGPEVLFRNSFKAGSTIKIKKVLKTKSNISSSIRYVVEETSSSAYKDDVLVVNVYRPIDENWGLDPSIYKLLKSVK